MILIDSNFYIHWIRQIHDVRFLLRSWIQSGQLFSCGVIRAEVIRGVISPKIKDDLTNMFDILPEIPTDARTWQEVTDLAWRLDRKGRVLPLADLIIAVCALRVHATVISSDRHFLDIPGLKTRKNLPPFSG